MENTEKTKITVSVRVNAPVKKVWNFWNAPQHIVNWCSASPDWHTPKSENDLRTGGKFSTRMEAKDGSFGFDFGGTYEEVVPYKTISYTMDDGRAVEIYFVSEGDNTLVTETFEAENTNPIEMQRGGWQAIMDNFKKYTEEMPA
jgi:uncharacterized protein YndB with AHSA1/START domain